MTLERCLADLNNSAKQLKASSLASLSGLSREEVKLFQETWAQTEPERLRQAVTRLVELTDDNLELDFEHVFRLCLSDDDDEVRQKAIEGLWGYEERSLIEPFIALLKRDRSEPVRAAAAIALGRFAMLAELEELRPADAEKVEAALLSVIYDKEEQLEVKRRAIEAISPLSRPHVRDIITQAYASDERALRVSALYAMGCNCDLVWFKTLAEELSSEDPECRFEAARACGELGDERAVPRLIALVHDSDPQVQLSAIGALGQIGGADARRELESCLERHDSRLREAADAALEELAFNDDPISF